MTCCSRGEQGTIPVVCNSGKLSAPSTCCRVGEGWDGTHGSKCEACEAGKYEYVHTQSCIACSAGRYASGTGQRACAACTAGQYQPSQEQTSCITCPTGTTSDTGASSVSSCHHCLLALQFASSGTCGSVLKHGSTCVANCSTSNHVRNYNLANGSYSNGSYGLSNGSLVTGMCTGNTDPTQNVVCPSGFVVKRNTYGACSAGQAHARMI